ncbi:hypothetical protein AQJ91_37025 [Streptomyces dysideae]|uniref:YncI copper-binding domain-containing protein n=1 Tax=Streptomyces dysideae TaxID=909626 RepID=A0A101USW5_9ACTN|nr:hypothetical protein AQJ91_37025 [Streptomyces dysideae]
MRRTVRRAGIVGTLALTAFFALAGPAAAHVEVEADTAQALAENVTLTFVSEAESTTAGFTQVRVVLPEGIAPGDVTLEEAPKGWKFKATADGYTVGGPEIATGTDGEHKIKVRQLPDARELAFKAVETYGDGKISRWIELPTGGAEPEEPAPVLKLKAAAAGATPVSPSPTASEPAAPTPSATEPASPAAASQAAADEKDEGSSTGLIVGGAVAALLALGGGAWWWLSRRRATSGAG